MANQELTHEEVWDDTALVDSWNEAFEEYKVNMSLSPCRIALTVWQKYHSMAARGEKVKVETEAPDQDAQYPQAQLVEEIQAAEAEEAARSHLSAKAASPSKPAVPDVPKALLATRKCISIQRLHMRLADENTVQGEDLKNLMMSWYYAGYYTGLYEGKQQGYASAKQSAG